MTKQKLRYIRNIIIAFLLAVIIVGSAVLVMMILSDRNTEQENDNQGVAGIISDNWDPNVSKPQDDNGRQQKGTQIPGYSTAVMNEGDMTLKISIGNPKENTVGFIATLKLMDGTVLYTSPLLNPGQGMEEVPLNQTLSKGTYDAEVCYQCVAMDEEQSLLNAAESAFQLIVN